MTLQHHFQYTGKSRLVELFQGVNKFSTLVNNIQKLSTKDPNRYDPDQFKGDSFEFFVELFLKAFPFDNRVCVSDYSPNMGKDNGVDGIGTNIHGEPSVVQVKFRGNTDTELTANQDHIGNLITDGILTHRVAPQEDVNKPKRHYVFTTAKGLHYYTENEFLQKSVKCFGYNDFRSMLDNNVPFWNWCRKVALDLAGGGEAVSQPGGFSLVTEK